MTGKFTAVLTAFLFITQTALADDAVLSKFTTEEKSVFEAFARDDAMLTAQVSPDGKHILTIIREGVDTDPVLLIFDTDDLSKRPIGVGAGKMEVAGANFVNNERILMSLRQDIDTLERLGVDTRQGARAATVDVNGKNFTGLPRRNFDRRSKIEVFVENLSSLSVFNSLPWDPDHILALIKGDIFKVNVNDGSQKLVARRSDRYGFVPIVDRDGDVRLRRSFSVGDNAIVFYARRKNEDEWFEIGRVRAADGEKNAVSTEFSPLGFFNEKDPNELWVISNHESNTSGVYALDLKTRKFKELLFRHPEFDASGVMTKFDKDRKPTPIGFFHNERHEFFPYLTDPEEAALMAGIDQILPNAINRIGSRSDDGRYIIVTSNGPQRPTAWYLLIDQRQIVSLGTQRPELKEDDLSPAEWVSYRARDGRKIWSIVTTPKGKGPFPAVVMPHGGPIARDSWGFDPWAQMLASFGYVVIQPQFRISEGFGTDHLEAGYAQWGLTQQDDIDDAGSFLVKRGLAKADNIAIFGWSYGGYAAFIGSARDPNPYKCAIAGAGVADVPLFRAEQRRNGSFTEKSFLKTLDGLNPLDMVDSVDIPILVIHGDDDERVPIVESDKFVNKLKSEGKVHKYVVLKGANHFFGTIYYRHYMEMYPAMIDWLDNTCGMKQ